MNIKIHIPSNEFLLHPFHFHHTINKSRLFFLKKCFLSSRIFLDEVLISSEFQSETFQNSDLSAWSLFPTLSSYVTDCNSYHLVGGYNTFGQGAFMSKYLTSLLPHYLIRIQLFLLTIDNWGTSDAFQIMIDSQKVYEYKPFTNTRNLLSTNQCGAANLENSLFIDLFYPHTATQFMIKLTSNLQQLSSHASWGVNNITISFEKCDITCMTCSNFLSYSCNSCYNLATLSQGICTCSNGYYLNVPSLSCTQMPCLYCSPCFSTCKTCAASSYQDCSSCTGNLYLEPSYECSVVCINPFIVDEANKKCISPCNSNQYVDKSTRNCQICNSQCETCYGPLDSNCLTCSAASGTFLNYKTCVTSCPNGKYADPNTRTCLINCNSIGASEDPITKQCTPFICNPICTTCKFPNANYCLTCNSNQVLVNNTCLNLICHETCLTCFGLDINQCLSCKSPKILENNQCLDCDTSCLTCDGTGNNNCLSCISIKFFQNNYCITCPFPMIVYNSQCISCDSTCKTCNGPSSDNCLSCNSPKMLNNTFCTDLVCHSKCKTCSGFTASECLSCYSPKILINNQCMPCNPECLTCNGILFNNCLSCPSPKLLYQNKCLDLVCDSSCLTCSGFTATECLSCRNTSYFENQQCLSCDQSCLTCKRGSPNDCSSCLTSKLFSNGQCLNCPPPMIVYNSYCINCDSTCKTCNGPTSMNCLSCYSPKMLNISFCTNLICHSKCQTCFGFTSLECLSCYPPKILLNNECVPCDTSCLTCSGPFSDNCLSCPSPKFFYQNKCVDLICHPSCLTCSGFGSNNCLTCRESSFYTNDSQCVPCHESCLTCSGISMFQCKSCTLDKLLTLTNQCLVLVCDLSCLTCSGFTEYECLSCDSTKVLINGTCQDCDPSCSTCSNVSSNTCLTCPASSYLTSNFECFLYGCEESCEECSGPSILECIECKDPRNFIKNLCLFNKKCPPPLYWNSSMQKCSNGCSFPYWNLIKYQNCITECPKKGFYSDIINRICIFCPDNCEVCLEDGTCSVCKLNYFNDDGRCVSFCPYNKYSDSLYICQFCEDICLTCDYSSEIHCLSCKHPLFFDGYLLKCVDQCLGSQYENYQNGRCDQCHSDCLECFGPYSDNCIKCEDPTKFLIQKENICLDECPYYTVEDKINRICLICVVENCSICEFRNPRMCKICKDYFFLDITQTQQCKSIILVNIDIELIYDPTVYSLTFDQDWLDLFNSMLNQTKNLISFMMNNSTRILDADESILFDYVLLKDDINDKKFFLNFSIFNEFKTMKEIFFLINYNSPPPPKYQLKTTNFSLNASSFKICANNKQYYNTSLKVCLKKISLTPNILLNYEDSQQVFLNFPASSPIGKDKILLSLIASLIQISIDVKTSDNYTYNITQNSKDFFIKIKFQESEIGRPLLSLSLITEKIPISIRLNPAYSISDITYANLLPTYVLSESTKKAINSSSNATSIGDIVSQATAIVNTILNSGSAFIIRGLMLSQYIYSLAYLNIQYPPNCMQMFNSQQQTKAFNLPQMTEEDSDIRKLPEVFLFYKKSPFFLENYGANLIQILVLLLISILVKLLFKFKFINELKFLKPLFFFLNWNFVIVYVFTQINKLVMYGTINIKYANFETFNGRLNFIIALFGLFFAIFFFFHIVLVTYTLKRYALIEEIPVKPASPKKLKPEDLENFIVEDENNNIFQIRADNLEKGLNLINDLKKNTVVPLELISEALIEESPIKKVKKKNTVLESMLASPKRNLKNQTNVVSKEKKPKVPMNAQEEMEIFELEKQNYINQQNLEQNPLQKSLIIRQTKTADSDIIPFENLENNEDDINLKKNKDQKSNEIVTSDKRVLEDIETRTEIPSLKLTDLFQQNNSTIRKSNIWKLPSLKKSLAQINKQRLKKNRPFFIKAYDFCYVPHNLADYREKFAILHREVKQGHKFQTYFISIDLGRHISMSFLLIMILEHGILGISLLFFVNIIFLYFLIKYKPIKSRFFTLFSIMNEIFINVTFVASIALSILDYIDNTGYIQVRINFGWTYVFSSLCLLYFLILMTVMRFLRSFLLSFAKLKDKKQKRKVISKSESRLQLENFRSNEDLLIENLKNNKSEKLSILSISEFSQSKNEIQEEKQIQIDSLTVRKKIEEEEKNEYQLENKKEEFLESFEDLDKKIKNKKDIITENPFEEALKELGVTIKKEIPIRKKKFVNDRGTTQVKVPISREQEEIPLRQKTEIQYKRKDINVKIQPESNEIVDNGVIRDAINNNKKEITEKNDGNFNRKKQFFNRKTFLKEL